MKTKVVVGACVGLLALGFAPRGLAVSLGQIDNFENGTLQNWGNGNAGAPALLNISTGGPAGANDHFLQITADGAGAGSRLTGFNRTQWLGNYIAAGVTAIEVDLRNLGSVTLSIRLAFKSTLNSGAPAYLTAAAVLPVGGAWQHIIFSLAPANLIGVAGPPAYNTMFTSGIAEVRFIDEVSATNSNGDIITGQLGVDNIHAIPEPSVTALGLAGLALFMARWRLRR